MLCLNVGSGQRKFHTTPTHTWLNVDINPKWEPDIVSDGASMPQVETQSVDVVVLHHCAEHMTLGQSQSAFREAHRVLKPGGSLLVFVPNLEALTRAWIAEKITDYIFCVNLHGAYMDDEADIHRWSFTPKSLKEHITSCAQWCSVVPFNWRPIPGSSLAQDWWILGVEALK